MTKPAHRLCHTWVGNTCKYCGIKYECAPREAQPIATLHDDGYWTWKKGTTPPHESNYAGWRMDVYAAPQAECAPREAQPVAYLAETFDDDLCPVNGLRFSLSEAQQFCWYYANGLPRRKQGTVTPLSRSLAAPTPERADADTAGANERDALKQKGLDDHLRRLQQDGVKSEERADAEKDAALTNEQIEAAIEAWFDTDGKDVDDHQSRMRAAILAANKEK